MVNKQDYIKKMNIITQWTFLALIIFGEATDIIVGIILTYMIVSAVI
jgi:hypothetical protein